MRNGIAIMTLALLLLACAGGPEARTPADEELYRRAAMNLIEDLAGELQDELMSAVDERGVLSAVDVCQVTAPKLAAAHSVNGWAIRRVSDRHRNPDNAADSHELEILSRFDTSSSPPYVEEWDSSGSVATYRFYKPIRTSHLCLNCHGTQERLAEGLVEKVRRIYPDDQATGYELNQLRGMFVVRGHWPEGKAAAEALTASTE
jgi:starvation-inducible outer membrane lipoprotein